MESEFEPTLLPEETPEEMPEATSQVKPKKKRGRPTKAESEAKRLKQEAEDALRGPVPETHLSGNGSVRFVSQRYLLRPGTDESQSIWITLAIPADMTLEEAERLATFVSSCYYTV